MTMVVVKPPLLDQLLNPRLAESLLGAEADYLHSFDPTIIALWSKYCTPYYSAKLLPPSVSGVYLTVYFTGGTANIAFSNLSRSQWSAPMTPEDMHRFDESPPGSFPYYIQHLYWKGINRNLAEKPLNLLSSRGLMP